MRSAGRVELDAGELRRRRQTRAYSSASASGVYQSGSALPVVPLVLPLISFSGGMSDAMKDSGALR